jgi:hypothetical protein
VLNTWVAAAAAAVLLGGVGLLQRAEELKPLKHEDSTSHSFES